MFLFLALFKLLFVGYPRTLAQCNVLHNVIPPNLVIEIDVPRDVIIDRMSKRWIHEASGRTYNLDFSPPKVPVRYKHHIWARESLLSNPLSCRTKIKGPTK